MKLINKINVITVLAVSSMNNSHASTFLLKITNGSPMPISPGVISVAKMNSSLIQVGDRATAGFTKLCQTGSTQLRLKEVQEQMGVYHAQSTPGPIIPDQSQTIEVNVPTGYTINFEAMYGKTKDACSVFSIHQVKPKLVISGTDKIVITGMFENPSVMGTDSCINSNSAVECLRSLSKESMNGRIRFFQGYLPSILHFIEEKFGAIDTQTILLGTSGSVQYMLTSKNND